MRTKSQILLALFLAVVGVLRVAAQASTAFLYQGQLQSSGASANGLYDFIFTLSNSPSGGAQIGTTVTNSAVAVTNGLFSTSVDFGAVFDGSPAWLNLGVRSNGLGSFTNLSPAQQLLAVPFAQFASNAVTVSGPISAGQLPSGVILNNSTNAVLSNLVVTSALSFTNANYDLPLQINYSQNSFLYGDESFNVFVGTGAGSSQTYADNNSGFYLIEDNTAVGEGAMHVNTGSFNTSVGYGTLAYNFDGGNNTALGSEALVYNVDGSRNTAVGSGALSSLGTGFAESGGHIGGSNNIALGFQAGLLYSNVESYDIVIGSPGILGENGAIHLGTTGLHSNTFIAGVIHGNAAALTNLNATNLNAGIVPTSVLPGFQSASNYASVGGGVNNIATNTGATVPGGTNNIAGGLASFAAGAGAQAISNNSFVWSDGSATTLSYSNNSVTFRATNGLRFYTGTNGAIEFTNANHTGSDQAVTWAPGDASWNFTSDRNTKDRFAAVDGQDVLDKIARLPISEWSYKGYSQRHIGAMAQDFHELFPLNNNDKSLNDADLHGVELAAIKGLNQRLQSEMVAKDSEIADLKKELQELRDRVNQLAAHP